MKALKIYLLVLPFIVLFNCEESIGDESELSVEITPNPPKLVDLGNSMKSISIENSISAHSKVTSNKSSNRYNVAIHMAEYITSGEGNEMGNVVFFSNTGNKQLGADFVPGLALDGTDAISYYVDDNRPSEDLDVSISNSALDRAMSTWDDVLCSDLRIFETPYDGRNTGFIALIAGNILGEDFGGSPNYVADVMHGGWLPARVFDLLEEGGSQFILGVTFTITFVDENGNDIDTNNDKKADVAWREIYYNENFLWNDGATYDVETIALHETGHGLSQAHFGKAFLSGTKGKGNVKLHFSPRAVMNASYSGVQTDIEKTDNAGHCSNWSQWPNN